MEQVKALGSMLSLMQSWLLLMLKHIQRQQNASHLHCSLHAAAAIPQSCILHTATAIPYSCILCAAAAIPHFNTLCTIAPNTCLYNTLPHTAHIWIPVLIFSASTLLLLSHVFILHILPFCLDYFVCSFILINLENKMCIIIYERLYDAWLSEKKKRACCNCTDNYMTLDLVKNYDIKLSNKNVHNGLYDEANSPVSHSDPSFGHDWKSMRKYYVIQCRIRPTATMGVTLWACMCNPICQVMWKVEKQIRG